MRKNMLLVSTLFCLLGNGASAGMLKVTCTESQRDALARRGAPVHPQDGPRPQYQVSFEQTGVKRDVGNGDFQMDGQLTLATKEAARESLFFSPVVENLPVTIEQSEVLFIIDEKLPSDIEIRYYADDQVAILERGELEINMTCRSN